MGYCFYTQDRGVQIPGEEIYRMDTALWSLLSLMYRVSCEEESHVLQTTLQFPCDVDGREKAYLEHWERETHLPLPRLWD